jgi:ribosomal protein S27E
MVSHLDGNVLAGPLSELFRDDMTTASARCAGCGDISVLAEAMVYDAAPGWAVRCHACGDVLLTMVRVAGRLRLDLRGITALEV